MTIYKKLLNIQTKLKAPKGQRNNFGNYNYRSCEDILEAVKPLLKEEGVVLNLSDEIIELGGRFYVRATARVIDVETGDKVETTALAREDETKKGMDLAQITGSVSSYARKYALNGLFSIDDTKDSDATNTHGKETPSNNQPKANTSNYTITEKQKNLLLYKAKENGFTEAQILQVIKKEYNLDAIMEMNKSQFDIILNRVQAPKK